MQTGTEVEADTLRRYSGGEKMSRYLILREELDFGGPVEVKDSGRAREAT